MAHETTGGSKWPVPELLINVGFPCAGIAVGLWLWLRPAAGNATRSDIDLLIGLIVATIGFGAVVFIEAFKAQRRIANAQRLLSQQIGLDRVIYPLDQELTVAVNVLCERLLDVEGIRRKHLSRLLVGTYEECSIPIASEAQRIKILTEIVDAAKNYVFACTYANYEYLRVFWEEPSTEIHAYYAAQKRALKRGVDVKRIFIKPADIVDQGKYDTLLDKIIAAHRREAGLERGVRVFIIAESEAEAELEERSTTFKRQSFFVCDGQFCSSGEAHFLTTDANSQRVTGSVNFFSRKRENAHPSCEDFHKKFQWMEKRCLAGKQRAIR